MAFSLGLLLLCLFFLPQSVFYILPEYVKIITAGALESERKPKPHLLNVNIFIVNSKLSCDNRSPNFTIKI